MKLKIYSYLRDVNGGFHQVLRGLARLKKHGDFHCRELQRFADLSKETRAAVNSYIVGELERIETADAGRRFRRRRQQEQREESGSG